MTPPWVDAQASSTSKHHNELATPLLALSSAQAGWEGLSVEVFHEPRVVESWSVPTDPDIILGLYTGGPIHVERRQAQGSWKGGDLHQGDLLLNWGGGPSYEARWWSLSPVQTQVLNLRVSWELVARVAEEVAGTDLASLELVGHVGFRDPLLSQMALALWRELEQPAPAGKLYAQSAAQVLAVHLVRQYISSSAARLRAVPPPPSGLTERQIKQVLEFIGAHLGEDLSLDTLAQQVDFSPFYFARLFRQAIGASPHQVVLRQRIERAQRLLQETELSLAQVSEACGFAHQSHMTQVFKQQLGCTPRAYRKEYARRSHILASSTLTAR